MGIQGLLQFLKDASESVHMKKYKGQTVAVDTYCWLHKGAFACAEKLAKGEPTDQYVAYCMKFVHMLLMNGVKPILVFDGCTLPSKKDVEKARREKRQTNLQKGKQLLREGKLSEARDCFSRSINVTSAMAHEVIKTARAEGVDCIVAPYEADSQLAYLNKNGFAQAIITEDSDLLAFGCKKVILKLDKFGNGLEIDQARLGMCKQLGDVFTEEKFRYMCILSGCDYLPSIHGIGLAKACKLIKTANNPDILKVIKKIGQYLKMNITVPDGYIDGFVRANNTFLYQLVFDPVNRKLIPLNPYDNDVQPEELDYAGPNIGDSAALQIALGNADVNTMEQIDFYNPDDPQPSKQRSQSWKSKDIAPAESIWKRNYTPSKYVATERKQSEDNNSPRGLILPSSKTAKRPHDGGMSDSDIFSQYSFSKNKKAKHEPDNLLTQLKSISPTKILQPLEDCSNNKAQNSQPNVRNKFATLLQRRSEEGGSVSAMGTRSRFFYKPPDQSSSLMGETEQSESDNVDSGTKIIEIDSETEAIKEEFDVKTEKELRTSPVSEDCRLSLQAAPVSSPKGCFSWSGSLTTGSSKALTVSPSLLSLRKFQRVKPCLEPNTERDKTDCPKRSDNTVFSIDSSPSETQDVVESGDSSSEELDNSLETPCKFTLKTSPPERKIITSNSKVSGLLKSKTTSSGFGKKVKPTAPAKASGLSSRGRTKATHNNENKPALQATINDLWKNFSFKK
ncbi:exonuclease 1 [Pelobates fuscus]|uniref:exonuclease 1 n=1 Tax=Pelobates fuscus TaxID=191477 RepID=UPI002FE47F8E